MQWGVSFEELKNRVLRKFPSKNRLHCRFPEISRIFRKIPNISEMSQISRESFVVEHFHVKFRPSTYEFSEVSGIFQSFPEVVVISERVRRRAFLSKFQNWCTYRVFNGVCHSKYIQILYAKKSIQRSHELRIVRKFPEVSSHLRKLSLSRKLGSLVFTFWRTALFS